MNTSLHPVPNTAEDWAARLGAEDVSSEERAAFEAWLAADPVRHRAYEKVRRVEALPEAMRAHRHLFASLLAEVDRPNTASREYSGAKLAPFRGRWFALAAAAVVVVAVGVTVVPALLEADLQRMATRHGEQRSLTLADGSLVQLNTDTQIAYRVDSHQRQVRLLRGEAFFDVAKDEARPFVVSTPTAEIQVVGTQFSVRTRADDVEVIVKEGKVNVVRAQPFLSPDRLLSSAPPPKLALTPGHRLRLSGDASPSQVAAVDVGRAISWRTGILDIDAMTLDEVVAEVNRYVPTPFVIEDDSIRTLQLSGRFRLGDAESIRFMLRERLNVESIPRNGTVALRASKR